MMPYTMQQIKKGNTPTKTKQHVEKNSAVAKPEKMNKPWEACVKEGSPSPRSVIFAII